MSVFRKQRTVIIPLLERELLLRRMLGSGIINNYCLMKSKLIPRQESGSNIKSPKLNSVKKKNRTLDLYQY
jgi:hypothetical protein